LPIIACMSLGGSWNIKHNGGAVIFLSWADSFQPAKLVANGERICLSKLGRGVALIATFTMIGILTRPGIFLSLLWWGRAGVYQARGAVKTPRALAWLSFKDGGETRIGQTGKARSRRSLGPNFKTKIVIQAMGIRMYSSSSAEGQL
jgi:hypothetical protein